MSKVKYHRTDIISWLQQAIPLNLAGSWDNVGILVDSSKQDHHKQKVFLTIDLTPEVLDEAIEWEASIIIAYHPPIFFGLKSLSMNQPMTAMLLKAISHGILIYSPHSALDAVKGGMCDWLADQIGGEIEQIVPIERNGEGLEEGAGRIVFLKKGMTLAEICQHLSKNLKLNTLRVSGEDAFWTGQKKIFQIALCPGAGSSLFQKLQQPHLYLTGEMSHHDILDRKRNGQAVILTEHSNCERGYLPILESKMKTQFPDLKTKISKLDQDPIRIWSVQNESN
jgi:dinuclear metal center YbgI/SA1388 family protein